MSEKFSPALRIGDLNDLITPSQACIVSLKAAASTSKHERNENPEKVAPLIKPSQTEPVKISLKDCLACSGCITSAETVMLEKQSLDEFLSHINSDKAVIVSLSPQSRASLASYFDLSPSQVLASDPFENNLVKDLYDEWLGQPGSEQARKHMHTQYHPMVKSIAAPLHNW